MTRLTAIALVLGLAASGFMAAGRAPDKPVKASPCRGSATRGARRRAVGGAHPTRADSVQMRYVGRLEDGQVFSTSPGDGRDIAAFAVGAVIPGMSAALQLMRVGDHWRITMPPYLAYGPGRAFTAPPGGGAAVQAVQKRGIPPDATLVFDVELVAIVAPKAP